MRKSIQLIPEKVYSELPTISELIKPTIKGFSEDNLREIISIVACHVRKDEDDGPAPLSMTHIKRLVPQGDMYLTGLIDLEVIHRFGQYIPGEACYQYDFAPEYKSRYIAFPLDNAKLILRIETVWEELRKEASKEIWGHSSQTRYLRQLTIEPEALQFIERNYITDTHKFNCAEASVTRILNGDIFYKIDNTSKRFHSNVTNLDKNLRPYLRVNGERLVNADIKNSQPYLSTIILTNPSKISWLTENTAFAMLLQNLKVSPNQDVKNYISFVISGQLYEYLMTEFNLSRYETKRHVLRILFASNRMPKEEINRRCRQIFIRNFPTVHRIFSKVRGHERGDKFANFKRFSILLQRIESYLMLHVILKRIYKELPKVIAITIHDSVMTGILTNDVEAVRNIMIEELTSFVGFQPKIEIEGLRIEKRGKKSMNKSIKQYDATNLVSLN
ncbi:MAG: hypothetical protein MUO72_17730 [Bacteroidales bacterium]|nr:hypothetical protein [Bacteroidales bacterium]